MTRSKMNIVLPFPCNTHQLFVTSGAAFFVYLFTLIPRHCSHCHHHRFWVFFHCRNEKIWQHMPITAISTGDVEHLIHQVFLSSNTWFTGFSFFLGRVSFSWLLVPIFHNASSSMVVTTLNLGSLLQNHGCCTPIWNLLNGPYFWFDHTKH